MKSLKGSLLIASPGLVDPNFVRTVVFLAEHNAEGAFGLVLNRPSETKVSDIWEAIVAGSAGALSDDSETGGGELGEREPAQTGSEDVEPGGDDAEETASGASDPLAYGAEDLGEGIDAISPDILAFVGGPVQKNGMLLLHGHADLARDAEPVIPGVFVGTDIGLLKELLRREGRVRSDEDADVKELLGSETGGPSALPERPALPAFRVFCGYSGWGKGQLDSELRAGGWLTHPASAELVFRTPPEKLWGLALERIGGIYRFFALMPRNPEEN